MGVTGLGGSVVAPDWIKAAGWEDTKMQRREIVGRRQFHLNDVTEYTVITHCEKGT